MKIKELTVTAVIPTAQYANLQPSITVEVNDDYEDAKKAAMQEIAKFSQQYAEGDKAIGNSATTVKKLKLLTADIIDNTDVEIYFDKEEHAYYDHTGAVYESPSVIAERFTYPFPADAIAPAYANKNGVSVEEVKTFWRAKGDCSTTFGTALHQALETYGRFISIADKLSKSGKEVGLGIHPTFEPIVAAFFKGRENEKALYEPFIVASSLKRCGRIDRLVIVDEEKKICDIDDYKTNGDLYKQGSPKTLKTPYNNLPNTPVGKYTIQLNGYRSILEANGWTVRNMTLHHWDNESWKPVKIERVDV